MAVYNKFSKTVMPPKDSKKKIRATKNGNKRAVRDKKKEGGVEPDFITELRDNIIDQYKLSGDNNAVSTDDIFRMLDLYFCKEFYAYRHLHNSFDAFMDDSVPRFLLENDHPFSEIITEDKMVKHRFKFENVYIEPAKLSNNVDPLFPSDARYLSLTYSIIVYGDMSQIRETIKINDTGENISQIEDVGHTEKNRPLMIVPAMILSKYCNRNIYRDEHRDECKYDPGGYFIVNGSEKIVICQDGMVCNKPLVFLKKSSNISYHVVQVNSKSANIKKMMQRIYIKIKKDDVMIVKIPILHEVNVIALFRALGVESDYEIIQLCGYDIMDDQMVKLIRTSIDNCVNDSKESGSKIQTQDDAIDYLITKMKVIKKYTETNQKTKFEQKKLHLMELLKTSFLPHIESNNGNIYKNKAYYLGYMVNKLLRVKLGRLDVDNRDSYCNKRVDNIRELFEEIMMQQYKNVMSECNKLFINRMDDKLDSGTPYNVIHQFKASTFEQGFKASLMLGNWPMRKGVSQMLQRFSYIQLLSFLSRVDSQSGSQATSKLTHPRQVDASSIPFLDPVQTPEHSKIGLIKHLSMLGSLTIGDKDNTQLVKEFIVKYPDVKKITDVPISKYKNMYKVFLNGEWLGMINNSYSVGDKYTDNPVIKFYSDAKVKKLSGEFNCQMTSIAFDHIQNEIRFCTDSGRLYRPVIRINGDNEMMLTENMIKQISLNSTEKDKISDWDEFYMQKPYPIEFIDSEEQPYMLIAENKKQLNDERKKIVDSYNYVFDDDESKIINRYDDKFFNRYDYIEIHPSVLLGELTTNIPFCNRNQGPRNIFQYAQGRQGMGIYATNYRARTDISYILYNPDVPIVNTRTSKYTYTNILPAGSNAVVAIACYSGYNQEDSLVLNKTSIERGLFRSMSLKKYTSSITKNQETSGDDKFMRPPPDKTIGIKNGQYDKMNENGYVPEETHITNGDMIFGKVTPISDTKGTGLVFRDSSEQYKSHADGVVDRVYIGIKNQDGYETRKALVRSERTPYIGDKLCCYSPDHEVLTTSGWIKINKLTKKHKVATLIDDNTLVYAKPLDIQEYNYNGYMYEVDSDMVKLCVTPNHRMWVMPKGGKSFRIEKAEDIINKCRKYKKNVEKYIPFNKTTKYINNERKFILPRVGDIKECFLDMKTFLTFLGIWITSGYVDDNNGELIIVSHNQKVKDALDKCCKKMEFAMHKYIDNITIDNIRICDKRLVNFFKPYSLSVNKYLPEFVWDLKMNEVQWLINGMMLECGCVNGNRQFETSSKRLADDFQRLCLHGGYSTNISIKYKSSHNSIIQNEIIKSTTDACVYRMSIIEKQNNPIVNNTKKMDRLVKYDGNVYCCTVNGNGVLYVRYKNYPVWCGNSRHGQKGTIGITMESIDMPFTKHGIRPDIIMNPNAIPSRMTIGQLWEALVGKVGALHGMNMDGTAFEDYDLNSIKDKLEAMGYHREGIECLYNGMTGKMMKHWIFIGPTWYQRLKHMVLDKMHCLTPDHNVLVEGGWKNIAKITPFDKIAIMGEKNLSYSHPTQIINYHERNRKIITLYYSTGQIMKRITEEHKVYVSIYDETYDAWTDYFLIEINKLIDNDIGKLNVRMMSGCGNVINEPLYYDVQYENTSVHCLTVSGGMFIVRHIDNDDNKITPENENVESLISAGVWTGNSRARGPVTTLTRNAPEGRSRDGGLRLGKPFRPKVTMQIVR